MQVYPECYFYIDYAFQTQPTSWNMREPGEACFGQALASFAQLCSYLLCCLRATGKRKLAAELDAKATCRLFACRPNVLSRLFGLATFPFPCCNGCFLLLFHYFSYAAWELRWKDEQHLIVPPNNAQDVASCNLLDGGRHGQPNNLPMDCIPTVSKIEKRWLTLPLVDVQTGHGIM